MSSNLRKSVLPPLGSSQPASPLAQDLADLQAPVEHSDPSPTLQAASSISIEPGVEFQPTEAMARVKARMGSSMAARGWEAGQAISLADAKQMTNSAALASWWNKPGFQAWFLNSSVTAERMEWLLHLSLSAAEDILLNTDPKAQSARVAMAKIVMDNARAAKQAQKESDKGSAIEHMNKAELESLLQQQGIRLERVASVEADRVKTVATSTPIAEKKEGN